MITYPNQKIIHINKPQYTRDYLTVGIDEWVMANRNLKPITFKLYLYLAGNANAFDLALSRQNIMDKLGISKNSYISAVKELKEKGYIRHRKGNVYDFYTDSLYHPDSTPCTAPIEHPVPMVEDEMYLSNGTEISIKDNINSLSENADAKKRESSYKRDSKKSRALEDLSLEELQSIKDDYAKKIDYKVTRERLRLNRQVSKEMQKEIAELIKQKEVEINNEKVKKQFANLPNDDVVILSEFFRCDKSAIIDSLCVLGVDVNYMLRWIQKHGETTQKVADSEEYADYRKDNNYDSYFQIVQMMIRNNKIEE